ncbi:MAG: class I SAM-dependent methyltransferase [Coriobacteriia bacterium]|nr:class I SAM-dependent methyltransferase [Coriobacteriia bacterium]
MRLHRANKEDNSQSSDQAASSIGGFWSDHYQRPEEAPTAWWHNERVIRHINKSVDKVDSPIVSEGLNQLLIKRLSGRQLKLGVSVGCGLAQKEMRILQLGIVEKFILFELSEEAARIATKKAQELHLEDRIEFHIGDAFEYDFSNVCVDFVHWNNSLHHMFDVMAAIKWSYDLLEPNGVLYLDEYVGPSRFQYSDEVLQLVNDIRDDLPHKYLRISSESDAYYGRIPRLDLSFFEMEGEDPSEAVDSERILESIKEVFPHAEIIPTGGVVYFLALSGILNNFLEEDESSISILNRLLNLDRDYAQSNDGVTLYAVALAFK